MAVEEKSMPMVEINGLKFTYFGIDGQPLLVSTFLIDDISYPPHQEQFPLASVGDLAGIPTILYQMH